MKKIEPRACYPVGYLEEAEKPSDVRQWIDGQWVTIPYFDRQKFFTDKRLKKSKKEKKRKKRNKKRGQNPKTEKKINKKSKKVEFYEGKPWKMLRAKVLKTYGWQCMKCGIKTGIMQVDHIKPRSKYPELELTFSNMQVLCRPCNMMKSNYHSTDYRGNFAELDILSDALKRF